MSTLYDDLGVQSNCTQDEIEKAYKKSALRYHPDRNPGDNEAAVIFLKIQQAYDILKDPSKRRDYDLRLHGSNQQPWHFHVHQEENLDLQIVVDLQFEDTVIGIKKSISFRKKFACHECAGMGHKKFQNCQVCHGTGNLRNLIAGFFNFQTPCHGCGGRGRFGVDSVLLVMAKDLKPKMKQF